MAEPDDVMLVMNRFKGEDRQRLDDWRRRQPTIPPASEAVRVLMRIGLDMVEKRKITSGEAK